MNYRIRLFCLYGLACLLAPMPVFPDVPVTPAATTARLAVLPEDGRSFFTDAFASARQEIRIEICVLEDEALLRSLQAALHRGVRVRAIVDQGKYAGLSSERANLATYLTGAGGELHLSNPIFPRSFPKIILIDNREFLLGSACLDQTTFDSYRDFVHRSQSASEQRELARLFENDWAYSTPPGQSPPPYNPTPKLVSSRLMVAPVNAAVRMTRLYQQARKTLDVYTELLGNPTLESELVAAVRRGVRVRLIAPGTVNNGSEPIQQTQARSLAQLKAAGVVVRVSGPGFDYQHPYMHARAAIVDGRQAYLGSVSLSPDSITFNREAGMYLSDKASIRKLAEQFALDFNSLATPP